MTMEEYADAIWVKIPLMAVGCMYRSPNSTMDDNGSMNRQIKEVCSKGYSHILIMGDYNMPAINWATWSTHNRRDHEFIECLRDSFLHQHVKEATRYRVNQNENLLDLIMTNEEDMISDIATISH